MGRLMNNKFVQGIIHNSSITSCYRKKNHRGEKGRVGGGEKETGGSG